MEKKVFKICEAVQLGLDYYYMGLKDRRKVTDEDRIFAYMLIPALPKGWMQESYEWQVFRTDVGRCGKKGRKRK